MNRIAQFFESGTELPPEQEQRSPSRHRHVMTATLLDQRLKYVSKSELTVDQYGVYWVDRRRPMSAKGAVKHYGEIIFGTTPVEADYTENECLKMFRAAVRD